MSAIRTGRVPTGWPELSDIRARYDPDHHFLAAHEVSG
jgi:hypothetical protein